MFPIRHVSAMSALCSLYWDYVMCLYLQENLLCPRQ